LVDHRWVIRNGVISHESWALVEPELPSRAGRRGRLWRDHRQVLEGMRILERVRELQDQAETLGWLLSIDSRRRCARKPHRGHRRMTRSRDQTIMESAVPSAG
jgi:hypothetical protein